MAGIDPLYRVWTSMWSRCRTPSDTNYRFYGARGITVCERWSSFKVWLSDMGPRPPGTMKSGRAAYSIDRIDSNGNYEPGNCRWTTKAEQALNMRSNRWLTAFGITAPASEWSRIVGMNQWTLLNRIRKGASVENALTVSLSTGCPIADWPPYRIGGTAAIE